MAKKEPTKAEAAETTRLQGYLDAISKYDRAFKKWEERNAKIIKRYRDEGRESSTDRDAAKFNILWSNVQTLVPATFARVPQPDVSRRFRDQDQVGRVAALLLERGLEFETQHYPDYRDTMNADVHDRFLGGRGTAWVRYEPHFKPAPAVVPDGGVQVTEDVDAVAPEEQLDYECAPVDYVHWRDFGHSVARTWEEVTLVWRRVYMSESAVEERFGEEVAKKIPYDSTPDDLKKIDGRAQTDAKQQACVIELWDKEKAVAVWFSKSMKEFLDEKPDPLKLQHFFPCPKPLYATLTNEQLVPVPDFTLYQDQAYTLDSLAERAAGLSKMLQVKGVYDASADASIGRLFTEGMNGNLMPVKNWAAFAEKNGLKGQIDVLDLTPIAKALETVYLAADQQKQQVYEIMGISDIVRGASDPNETLGAQELKGQYASMRLRAMQAEVARFATDVLQIKAQIMCSKFAPQTLIAISAAEQLSEQDKQHVPAAMALLVGQERLMGPAAESPNPLRAFRIDVNADSMVQMNEAQEKTDRLEFITAQGGFMKAAQEMVAGAGAAAPAIVPLIMELWKFSVTAFKVGKTIEGAFDEAAEKMKQLAAQPPQPKPDPEMAKVEAQKASDQARLQHDQQVDGAKAQSEQAKEAAIAQRESQAQQAEHGREMQRIAAEERCKQHEAQVQQDTELRKTALQVAGQIEVARINAGVKAQADAANAKIESERVASEAENESRRAEGEAEQQKAAQTSADEAGADARAIMEKLMESHNKLLETIAKPKVSEIERGADGKALRVVSK